MGWVAGLTVGGAGDARTTPPARVTTFSPPGFAVMPLTPPGLEQGRSIVSARARSCAATTTRPAPPPDRHHRRTVRAALSLALATAWLLLGGAGGRVAMASASDAPDNLVAPSIVGTLEVGQTLSADPGTWSFDPQGYDYSWLTCDGFGVSCAYVEGATQSTYLLTASDAGRRVELMMYAWPAGGRAEWVQTDPTGPVQLPASTPAVAAPESQTGPRVVGEAREGATLSADPGGWSGSPTAYHFQWYECQNYVRSDTGKMDFGCGGVVGATDSTFAVTGADIGLQFAVAVIAANPGGDSSAAQSPATGPVLPLPPVDSATPTLASGPVTQGEVLTVMDGQWSSDDWRTNPTYEYHWFRCSADLTRCAEVVRPITGQAYFLTADDIGQRIVAEVVAVNAGGRSTAVSNATGVVVGLPPGAPIYVLDPHLGPNGTPEFYSLVGYVPYPSSADSSAPAVRARALAICSVAHRRIAAAARPKAGSRGAAAAYMARGLGQVASVLRRVRVLRWSPAVGAAFAIEAQRVKLQLKEVPALRRNDLARVRRLGARAAALAKPADVVIAQAGLSVCLG